MAANDYYNSPSTPRPNRKNSNATLPQLPPDPYTAYSPHPAQPSAPYMSSPTFEDSGYRPYADQSQQSLPSPYYASGGGGRDHDQSAYSDDIPLRQNPSKGDSDLAMHDHLPDDPAIVDRPPQNAARRRRKQGFFGGKIPWVVYTFTLIQVCVFIAELAKNGVLTKTPIEVHPQFNPMIGPSPYVLINMGARYVPCMRKPSKDFNDLWPCPNTTSNPLKPDNQCKLNDLCGFGDKAYTETTHPNQWYRFIIPIFLHAGFIHITFNMLLQLLLGRDMEKEIGSSRFFLVYLSSGIFGFILGGNLAPEGIASTGASGSLFGIIALNLLDLLYHWGDVKSPWADLAWLLFDIVISFALGLLPGLDNFSHIGGFLMGLALGVCLLHSPDVLRRRAGADLPPYASVKRSRKSDEDGGIKAFAREPVAFFKGRKPLWWVWWLVRAAALIAALVCFIVLLKNFYKTKPTTCHWCRYLSCIKYKDWCDIGQLTTTNATSGTSQNKRNLLVGPLPFSLEGLL